MKKIKSLILTLLITLIMPVYVHAEIIPHKIYANPTQEVARENMVDGHVLTFKAVDKYKLTNDTSLEKDSIITVQVKEYVMPKRGKQDGHLKISVVSYTIPSEDNKEIDIQDKNISGTLKLSTKINKGEAAAEVGVAVAEIALDTPGLSQIYAATKGLIKPNEGQTRLKSVGTNLYNSTGLQYIEKGEELLIIKEDAVVEISVKSKEAE